MKSKEKYYKRVLDAIPTGRENAVTQKELAELFGVSTRDIRQAVQDARKDGVLIVSNTKGGYYFSDRVEDVEEHFRTLSSYLRSVKVSLRPAKQFLQKKREENHNADA